MGASALFGRIGGMVPKQRNPSRIQAQGATNSFADEVPNGSFETARSKAKAGTDQPVKAKLAGTDQHAGSGGIHGWMDIE